MRKWRMNVWGSEKKNKRIHLILSIDPSRIEVQSPLEGPGRRILCILLVHE